jgi:hypothetical protein
MTEVIRISNIDNYTQENINGELILRPIRYITENELYMAVITHSSIEECVIKKRDNNVIISTNNSYRSVLIDIWKSLCCSSCFMLPQQVVNISTFNFKLTRENGEHGYRWCEDIHMSFQNKNAKGTLKEIIHMVKENNLTIDLTIKLQTGMIIHFHIL